MPTLTPMTGPESRPLVLGTSRSARRDAVENTLAAFTEARNQGADGVELDVHRTADGALVVHHDAAVDGFGILAEHELADIRAAIPTIPTPRRRASTSAPGCSSTSR